MIAVHGFSRTAFFSGMAALQQQQRIILDKTHHWPLSIYTESGQ
jgi:hypothetical protein